MCGCVKSALSDTCENRPETKNATLSKNLENVDKRSVKQVQKLLEVGRFCAAKTFERVENVYKTSLAQFMLRHKRTERYQERDWCHSGSRLTQEVTHTDTKRVECVELQFTTKDVCWLHAHQLAPKLWG